MSFNFVAAGTPAQVVSSLGHAENTGVLTEDGQKVRDMLVSFFDGAASDFPDGSTIRYEVRAYGHVSRGSVPYLTITVTSARQS